MGKPFETELLSIKSTLAWALEQKTDDLKRVIISGANKPFYIIGSGGSFSSCCFVADLLQYHGFFAKPITPLAIHQNRIKVFGSNLIFISASGKNTDILSSYESALSQEPALAISISLKVGSPLKKKADKFSIGQHFEFDLPTGKDGFLATNSLIAFFGLLNKALSEPNAEKLTNNSMDDNRLKLIKSFVKQNASKKSFIVLYGGWGSSVAVDLESKFSEAALGNVLLSDYRNFGHGRHHWFDKQAKDSVIVMLITPTEAKLANKTISLLPKSIPHIQLSVDDASSNGSILLLIQSFYFVNEIGKAKKIDPGRPGVPAYGSKLYNLQYKKLVETNREFESKEYLAISRKVESIHLLNPEELNLWRLKLKQFASQLTATKLGGIVFDYDGTLCSSTNRFIGMSADVTNEISRVLEKGFLIGVATGRGKSVREVFQRQVAQKFWDQIVIGYYNGSEIGSLSNSKIPDGSTQSHESLIPIATSIEEHPLLKYGLEVERRRFQLTIIISDPVKWPYFRGIISTILLKLNVSDVQMVESSHSCDIVLKSKASKLNIFLAMLELAKKYNCPEHFLAIGDRGKWPGNDFELLTHPYSLSVDEVSPDISSCWNLASAGKKNIEATLEYLSKIKWNPDHSFSFEL